MPNSPKIKENTSKLLNFVSEKFINDELDNESLTKLIELAGGYLNLKTIPDYAKANKMSYNGVKKARKPLTLFNTKFIIDNE
jgi:hypothetical protein